MNLDALLAIMACPTCRGDLRRWNGAALCGKCGDKLPIDGQSVILGAADTGTPEWKAKQAESVERYTKETYNGDPTIPRMFGQFMAVTLDRGHMVIDIGCGIAPALPHYVNELGLENYFGLEPLIAPVERPFPCLSGAVAESIPLRTGSIDAALFATSQDHIADIDAAMKEVRRVVRPGGHLYMWIGLYEPEILWRAKRFPQGFMRGLLASAEYLHLRWRMWDRGRRLAKGIPIDQAHERWYTTQTVAESLDRWGLETVRTLHPPGVPGIFVDAVNPDHSALP